MSWEDGDFAVVQVANAVRERDEHIAIKAFDLWVASYKVLNARTSTDKTMFEQQRAAAIDELLAYIGDRP